MSLMRQLWLAVIAITFGAFTASLLIGIISAQGYLEQQLERKNSDNASSLALSMSQQEKDPVTVELQAAALFDTGYYQSIKIVDPRGKVIAEKVQERFETTVPSWFTLLFPINPKAGVAQVSDGWRQYATVTIVSHVGFAHVALWQQAQWLLLWFSLGGALAGALGMLTVRGITRPLMAVVDQARAIGERRFVTILEPRTPELRSMVRAMNEMVERVKLMFNEEAARLEELRRKVNHDATTGLANRDYFMAVFKDMLSSEDYASSGAVAVIRLADLGALNQQLGHKRADEFLKELGEILLSTTKDQERCLVGRIKGGDFAIVVPDHEQVAPFAANLAQTLEQQLHSNWPEITELFHLGAVRYQRGDNFGEILARVDQALALAESKGANAWHAVEGQSDGLAVSGENWQTLLTQAVGAGRLKLAYYPVMKEAGLALHQESVIRLQAVADGPWLAAGDFMPMAVRLNLTAPLDLEVIRLALDHIETTNGDVAVNLSAETVGNWGFHNELTALLRARPALSKRLWFEVPEYGAFKNIEAFRDFCRTIKALGCKIGIEHFGQRFGESQKLADLGLDYIKVHASFIHGIDENPGNQEFLKGFCSVAHAIGISVVAVGVQSEKELQVLKQLGFDGATGPGVAG